MSEILELARRAVLIGAGATMVMDLWAALLRRFGVPSLNLDFLGRWIGHLARGHWMHVSIAAAAPIRGERWIGWCAHYSIGVAFSASVTTSVMRRSASFTWTKPVMLSMLSA